MADQELTLRMEVMHSPEDTKQMSGALLSSFYSGLCLQGRAEPCVFTILQQMNPIETLCNRAPLAYYQKVGLRCQASLSPLLLSQQFHATCIWTRLVCFCS